MATVLMKCVTVINGLANAPASQTSLATTVTIAPPTTGTLAQTLDVNPANVPNQIPLVPTATCSVASVIVSQGLEGDSAVNVRRFTGVIPECIVKSVTATLWGPRWLSVTV